MSRLYRKSLGEDRLCMKHKGSTLDAFDDVFKHTYYLDDDEMDYIAEHLSEEHLSLVVSELDTFSMRKQALECIDMCLNEMYSKY